MNIPDWILDPFSSANTEESPQLQEELMEVTANDELKFKFKSGYQQFWLQKEIPMAYPEIWAKPMGSTEKRGVSVDLTEGKKGLYVNVKGVVRIAGKTSTEFDLRKGVKQGDSLSLL
ncbi:hypothetical protein J437_LFUL014031 [Ladona fulva]|uniref:Uncharacterized protein n=1 Tax=Ladona fulva TaxID=123851 RepID=A0A8K0P782_LADFU|nr:hypothetical protein J437_LFUL014031 [Ladona fulva]